jgi:hypothetical protein
MKQVVGILLLTMSVSLAGLTLWHPAHAAPVSIAVHASVEGQTLRIRGTATVPDGAWIIYAAYRTSKPAMRDKGYAQVRDNRFTAAVDISRWPPGTITVDANFQTLLPSRQQPRVVIERFGAQGSRMTGDDVVKGGGSFRAAVASATAIKP